MRRFDIIEHTADVGVVGYGEGLEEAFANAAYAMFTLMADMGKVGDTDCREVEVRAEDHESLLVSFLNELLYLVDTEGILFKRFDVVELRDTVLKIRCWGEEMDPARHELRGGVKAATYHMLSVERGIPCKVQVILDV